MFLLECAMAELLGGLVMVLDIAFNDKQWFGPNPDSTTIWVTGLLLWVLILSFILVAYYGFRVGRWVLRAAFPGGVPGFETESILGSRILFACVYVLVGGVGVGLVVYAVDATWGGGAWLGQAPSAGVVLGWGLVAVLILGLACGIIWGLWRCCRAGYRSIWPHRSSGSGYQKGPREYDSDNENSSQQMRDTGNHDSKGRVDEVHNSRGKGVTFDLSSGEADDNFVET